MSPAPPAVSILDITSSSPTFSEAESGNAAGTGVGKAPYFTYPPTFLIMLFGMWLEWVMIPLMPWLLMAFAILTMFWSGWWIKKQAFQSLRRGILNQHNLLEFGAFGGLMGGLLGLFVNPRYPAGDFFAVATFITTYHILSAYTSLVVRTRSSQAVRKLLDLQLSAPPAGNVQNFSNIKPHRPGRADVAPESVV